MNSSDLPSPVPVAIIGMGCMFPQAEDLARYWANIKQGIDAITEVPGSHWRVADYFNEDPKALDHTYAHRGGFLTPVDFPLLDFGIAPNSVEATDTTQLLGLMVARQALADAGCLASETLDRDRVSVILGVTGTLELVIPLGARLGHPIWRRALESAGVDPATTEDVVRRIADSYVGWQENSFPGLLGNVAAGRIANRLDLRGTNCVVDAACASSLAAINLATLELATGRCDLAVTGGFDTFNDIFMYMCFSKTPALSPTGDARPFDALADGTVLGEGLGALVLKRLDDARRDGDRIYAVIRSMGTSSDGKGQAVYAPSARGQVKALRQAYQFGGTDPGTIELVEAHGTGTKVGDAVELEALEEVYQGARPEEEGSWCALGSVKSQVGHTKAAAGAAGMIKAALALYHKVLPPTSKVRDPIGELAGGSSPFYLSDQAQPWLPHADHPRRAAVSAFGFGGTNFHCVLEEAHAEKPAVDWDGDVQILAFSSDNEAEITAALQSLASLRDWNHIRAVGSQSRAQFETSHRLRCLVVIERGKANLVAVAAAAQARLESLSTAGSLDYSKPNEPSRRAHESGRVFAGIGPVRGRLAMLFPGQGSQYVGMLRELACDFPQMQTPLAVANEISGINGSPLSRRIYPPTAFSEGARSDQDLALRDTRCAQPAIGAVSVGLLRILGDFGVRPDLAGGHSFGELTALCAAGCIDDRALALLAQERGAIMASCAHEAGGGAMLAVFAPLKEVSAFLDDHALDLVVANKNAPRQCVLSGQSAEIERTKRLLDERGIVTRLVPVSAPFHSPAVASAEGLLRQTLGAIDVHPSEVPVFANTTALPYPADPEQARALLAGQLARPVEFVAQIQAMHAMGARTFLEVGPDAKLTGLVDAILEGTDHVALAVDASRGAAGNLHDLACSLATLAALGYAVDLTQWDKGCHEPAATGNKPGLTVKISGANARPKTPPEDKKPMPPPPAEDIPHKVSPESSRFSIARENLAAISAHQEPPDHSETDWTMTPPDRIHAHRSNGQVSSHFLAPHDVAAEKTNAIAPSRATELSSSQTAALSRALENAQHNLTALERMAEQTAALHRQFLEGQEKTQQIFLKLLDQEQRLSLTLLDSPGVGTKSLEPRAEANGREQVSGPEPSRQLGSPPPALPSATHNNGKGSIRAAELFTAPLRPVAPQFADRIASSATGSVASTLIEVVADKTGYPAQVLDLDMQLDADLGIDSIKRVEILSALQDRLTALPVLQPEQLGTFRTLRAIVDFLSQSFPDRDQAVLSPTVPCTDRHGQSEREIVHLVVEIVADKTGYPADMLELDMRLDTDLGIDSIKRVEIFSAIQERLPAAPAAGPEQIGTLGTLREIVTFLSRSGELPVGNHAESNGAPANEAVANDPIERVLLEAVADKTGYPIDMLGLDMQLDTDLGIDSIKRVEILSAVQERIPTAGSISPDQLGSLATLRLIAQALAAPPSSVPAIRHEPALGPETSNGPIESLSAVAQSWEGEPPGEPRRNPARTDFGELSRAEPRPPGITQGRLTKDPEQDGPRHSENGAPKEEPKDLRLLYPAARALKNQEKRERLRLPAGGMVWISADGSPLTDALAAALRKQDLQCQVIRLDQNSIPQPDDSLCGLIILAPLNARARSWEGEPPGEPRRNPARTDFGELSRAEPRPPGITQSRLVPHAPTFIKDAFRILRAAGPALQQSASRGCAVFATVTRFDGSFGINGLAPESSPAAGALAGLAKTAGHEWRGVDCKALDLDRSFESPTHAADAIVDEIVHRGPAEVGLKSDNARVCIELEPVSSLHSYNGAHNGRVVPLGRDDLVAISGGARGVTAEVAVALAHSFGPRLVLLGRTPSPASEPDWMAEVRDDAQLKRALLDRSNGRLTPQELGEETRRLLTEREIRRNLTRIEKAGSQVIYRSVDVRDGAAVRDVLRQMQAKYGKVRGLIHGAGVVADRKITDQTDAQFDAVYDTKVIGLDHLFQAIDPQALSFLILFSSSTARFGRAGQVAYAAANEALNKWAQQQSLRLPHCRVISYNWGPWAGGMVQDSLKPLFEKEGIALIPLEAGARCLVDQIQEGGASPVEVVVLAEPKSTGGAAATVRLNSTSTPAAERKLEPVFRRTVDLESLPVLASHVIDGHAVLPMAIMLEWLAEGAIHRNPGLVVSGIDDLRLFKGVILNQGPQASVEVRVGKAVRHGSQFVVPTELKGIMAGGREVAHVRAEIILADRHTTGSRKLAESVLLPYPNTPADIYRTILFHGPALQGINQVEGLSDRAVSGWAATAPEPAEWLDRPLRSAWLTDPLAIDCAFQLVVLWCRDRLGANSLPTAIGGYRQFRRGFPAEGVRIQAEIRHASDTRAVADIEFVDEHGDLVARLDSYECVVDASLNQAFRRNQIAHAMTFLPLVKGAPRGLVGALSDTPQPKH